MSRRRERRPRRSIGRGAQSPCPREVGPSVSAVWSSKQVGNSANCTGEQGSPLRFSREMHEFRVGAIIDRPPKNAGFRIPRPGGAGGTSRTPSPTTFENCTIDNVGAGLPDGPPMPTASENAMMTTDVKQKDQPSSPSVIARSEATWQSRRFSPEPLTTGLPEGELPRRGKRGHPGVRPCGPRNDVVISAGRTVSSLAVAQAGRRGQCRPPYGMIFPGNDKKLHRPVVGLWSFSMLTCF